MHYVASGRVRSRAVRVSLPEGGQLQRLLVEANQPVKKGQLVAVVDDRELRQRLRQLEADLYAAQTRAQEAAATMQVRSAEAELAVEISREQEAESQAVAAKTRRGATREELQAATEKLRQAREKLQASERDLRRQKELFAQDIVSPAALEGAESAVRINSSAVREAQAQLQKLQKGATPEELAEVQSQVAQSRIKTMQSQQKTQEEALQAYRMQTAQADVQRIMAELEYTRHQVEMRQVTSPVGGVVSQVFFEPGEYVGGNNPILTVVTDGPYWIEAEVDEQDAAYVAARQPVQVTFTSMPGKSFPGMVSEVAPSLEARPQGPPDHKMLRIKVVLNQKVPQLRAGLEADVEGTVQLAKDVLSMPRAALRREGGEDFALTVQGGKLQKAPVRVGAVSSERVEIREGLAEGAEVVVEGGDGLPLGSSVRTMP